MGFFKSAKGFFRAKDRDAANAIENSNVIGFAENDLEDIEKDVTKVHENLGHIKGRIQMITDEIKDLTEQITNNTEKVQKLLDTKKPEAEALAGKMCTQIENLEAKKAVQEKALEDQKKLLEQQEGVEKELEEAYETCKNEMELMKTEKNVTDGNNAVTQVSAGSAQSAVSKFKERRKKLSEQLYTSQAMAEQTKEHGKSLDAKADEFLGVNKGSALLEKMKAKRDQKPAV